MTAFYDPPIFVNVRDRVSDLRKLVDWLEKAGHERITLLDNASTYEPCVEYLRESPHTVRYLAQNLGSRAIWAGHLVPRDEHWVYTDPDVLPVEGCPYDALWYMKRISDEFPQWPKVGLGLHLDDVPENMHSLQWEKLLVTPGMHLDGRIEIKDLSPGVYGSLVDTTFALYRPGMPYGLKGIRLGYPYQVRHSSWYRIAEPSEEERYYLRRAIKGPDGSSWAQDF